MPKFEVTVDFTVTKRYTIEAAEAAEAHAIAEEMLDAGLLGGGDLYDGTIAYELTIPEEDAL